MKRLPKFLSLLAATALVTAAADASYAMSDKPSKDSLLGNFVDRIQQESPHPDHEKRAEQMRDPNIDPFSNPSAAPHLEKAVSETANAFTKHMINHKKK